MSPRVTAAPIGVPESSPPPGRAGERCAPARRVVAPTGLPGRHDDPAPGRTPFAAAAVSVLAHAGALALALWLGAGSEGKESSDGRASDQSLRWVDLSPAMEAEPSAPEPEPELLPAHETERAEVELASHAASGHDHRHTHRLPEPEPHTEPAAEAEGTGDLEEKVAEPMALGDVGLGAGRDHGRAPGESGGASPGAGGTGSGAHATAGAGAHSKRSGGVATVGALRAVPARPRGGRIEPSYPPELERRGLEGEVELEVFIGLEGEVGEVRIARSSGVPGFDAAAVSAAKREQWLPAVRDGAPVASTRRFTVRFRLST